MERMLVALQDADCGVGSNFTGCLWFFLLFFWSDYGDLLVGTSSSGGFFLPPFLDSIKPFINFCSDSIHITLTRKPLREVNLPQTPPPTNHHRKQGTKTTPPMFLDGLSNGTHSVGIQLHAKMLLEKCWRDSHFLTALFGLVMHHDPWFFSHESSQVLVKNVLALPRFESKFIKNSFRKMPHPKCGMIHTLGFQTLTTLGFWAVLFRPDPEKSPPNLRFGLQGPTHGIKMDHQVVFFFFGIFQP